MNKHPELTLRRIQQFLSRQLHPLRITGRHPLRVEVNEQPCRDQAEAMPGPWRVVDRGFRYGPAYRSIWFRLTGTIPPEFDGRAVKLIAELGGERTVWRDGAPWAGMDVEHSDCGLLGGGAMTASQVARAGDPVEIYVESTARNPQIALVGAEPPREELVETVASAELVTNDESITQLIYDIEFTLSLLETIAKDDPAYSTILRALNDVVNLWVAVPDVPRARKVVRDALGALNGEFKHSVYAVGHSHLDTAWLWPISVTKRKMAHTTSIQLGLMERYPEYTFAHSQASQYEWLEKEYPVLFERVKAAIARGQWEPVGSMWVEADCNLTGGESLVRQFLYGRRYFRDKFGVQTQDMWLPDVFGYSAALPQILRKFDISYFMTQKISWNQTNKFPHHTFWWQGIDGSRVWAHFPPADTYNGSAEPKEVVFSVRNYKDHARADQSLYLFGFGDGGGGPTERHLEFLRRGRLAPNYPDLVTGKRAVDFFREAKSRSRDLQTWVGELYLELHRGTYTSQAANKRANRECEFLLRDAEWLATFHPEFPASYPSETLEGAWKKVLLNQFHDIIPGSSVREVYEDSAREYDDVRRAGGEVIDDALRAIGNAHDRTGMRRPIALFHNSTMVGQAQIPWDGDFDPTALITADETTAVQVVEAFGERSLVFSTPHAALGGVVVADLVDNVVPPKTRLKASFSNRRLENGEMAVRFDPNGNITSISSLEDGTEFIEPGRLGNLFQIFDDHPLFWAAWDVDPFAFETAQDLIKSESFEIVERGPVRVAIEIVKRFGASTIRQRISLGPTPGIRFDTEIDWRETDKLLKVAFPVNVSATRATYEIQFGSVERPTHLNTSWDQARFEVCAQKWIDLSEGDQGVALVNDGKYGHDVRGNVMRLTLLRSPKAPDASCDMGVHRFSYALVPHFGPHHYASVVPAAYAFNAAVRARVFEPGPGASGTLPPFVSCEDRNIVIETVKKAEDDDDVIVRLYECHNSRGRAELTSLRAFSKAMLCDLEENPIADLDVSDRSVTFDYKPFEILTLRLRA